MSIGTRGGSPHVTAEQGNVRFPQSGARPECILIVDDDRQVRQLTALMLKVEGFEVLEADGGAKALQLCEQRDGPIDLVLADVVMPRMGGRQVARQVRSSHPSAKVLLMSGYPNLSSLLNSVVTLPEAIEVEADFILKPFRSSELTSKIREILDRTD